MVFDWTRPGIEPESTTSVADALFTRSLIVKCYPNSVETMMMFFSEKYPAFLPDPHLSTLDMHQFLNILRFGYNLQHRKHLIF